MTKAVAAARARWPQTDFRFGPPAECEQRWPAPDTELRRLELFNYLRLAGAQLQVDEVLQCTAALQEAGTDPFTLTNDTRCGWLSELTPTFGAGAACSTSASCGAGLECARPLGTRCGQCLDTLPVGADCDYTGRCEPGASCWEGSCVADPEQPLSEGDACDTSCGPVDDLTCVQGTCRRILVASLGMECGDVGASTWTLCSGSSLTCNFWPEVPTCQPTSNVGDVCGFHFSNVGCNPLDATCIDGVCVAHVAAGDTCSMAEGAATGCGPWTSCLDGACADRPVWEPNYLACEATNL